MDETTLKFLGVKLLQIVFLVCMFLLVNSRAFDRGHQAGYGDGLGESELSKAVRFYCEHGASVEIDGFEYLFVCVPVDSGGEK